MLSRQVPSCTRQPTCWAIEMKVGGRATLPVLAAVSAAACMWLAVDAEYLARAVACLQLVIARMT